MKTLHEKYVFSTPDDKVECRNNILAFYQLNGYQSTEAQLTADESTSLNDTPDATDGRVDSSAKPPIESIRCVGELPSQIRLVRGRPNSGWWSSDLTYLHTTVDIEFSDTWISLTYCVDIRGQRLTRLERLFWRQEAQYAENAAKLESPMIDLRIAEAKRAMEVRRQMRKTGVLLSVMVFVLVSLFSFLGLLL